MKKVFSALGVVAVGVALTAGVGSAHTTYSHYYTDELTVDNTLEQHGVVYQGRHVNIENASCIGLRYLGVRSSAYGLDKFWRFDCDLISPSSTFYKAQVSTTTGPRVGYWYWHVISISKEF